MIRKIILLSGIFVLAVNTALAHEISVECNCTDNQMIQSVGRIRYENEPVVLRFTMQYDPKSKIGNVYEVTGESHPIYRQCKLDDKNILITYHNEDSKSEGTYRGQLKLNRQTGNLSGELDYRSYAKNGFGMDLWRFRHTYNGVCKPYFAEKQSD